MKIQYRKQGNFYIQNCRHFQKKSKKLTKTFFLVNNFLQVFIKYNCPYFRMKCKFNIYY